MDGGELDPVGMQKMRAWGNKGHLAPTQHGGVYETGVEEDFGPGGEGAIRSERHRQRQLKRFSHQMQPRRSTLDKLVGRHGRDVSGNCAEDFGMKGAKTPYDQGTQRLGEWKKGVPLQPLGAELAQPGGEVC